MTIEEQLRELIKERYGSLSEFSRRCGLPNSTISSVLTRGIGTATLSNILKICETLHISADALAKNKIVSTLSADHIKAHNETTSRDNDISIILDKTRHQLLHNQALLFNGKPADEESIQAILDAMEIGMEIAKRKTDKK